MHSLFPAIEPYAVHRLKTDDIHTLYIEEAGQPAGIPVLFLHGGPGAGCQPYHRQLFDPALFRVILFDQRGAGRSTPHASLADNTTPHLVRDIEAIRRHLRIDRWLVFGGSWGSTLALVYAIQHSQRVSGLILRGIFLCRKREIQWFYQDGANRIFPDYWQDFIAPIPMSERGDLLSAYYRRLTGDNETVRNDCARRWSMWEGRTLSLQPSADTARFFGDTHTALSLARIEAHYFMHDIFLEENYILRQTKKLSGIPGVIVHGRYDIVCPVESAWDLHVLWPESQLEIIPAAGHAASEPGITDALIRACYTLAGHPMAAK